MRGVNIFPKCLTTSDRWALPTSLSFDVPEEVQKRTIQDIKYQDKILFYFKKCYVVSLARHLLQPKKDGSKKRELSS